PCLFQSLLDPGVSARGKFAQSEPPYRQLAGFLARGVLLKELPCFAVKRLPGIDDLRSIESRLPGPCLGCVVLLHLGGKDFSDEFSYFLHLKFIPFPPHFRGPVVAIRPGVSEARPHGDITTSRALP